MELLIKKAQRGDKEAFMKLIDHCFEEMYKVGKTRIINEELIGDAIQETILSAYLNIHKLRDARYFKTWIVRILINKCNDVLKNSKIIYMEDCKKIEPSTWQLDTVEEKLDFEGVLNLLSQDSRTTVVLYYVNRFTVKEISEILGEKEGTIKSRLSRARAKLKQYYVKENELKGES